ncbi:hypothetical protein [Streptomyces cellulosae]|uniref:hypothetical protein n=1 Tax=Streptomyces cellulosae TaxID=1968 RepID=UPI00131DF64B|nr:hypothetical protein [Streptomyces cellulosae]
MNLRSEWQGEGQKIAEKGMSGQFELDVPFAALSQVTTSVMTASQHLEIRVRRFKKVMLATSVLSGVGLATAGAAQAACDDEVPHTAVDNAQYLHCEQEFTSLVTINAPITVLGDNNQNIGNFCTVLGSE